MSEFIFRELLTNSLEEADVLVYGLPFDKATSVKSGAALAPSVLRNLSSFLPPVSYGGDVIKVKIKDFGDCDDFLSEKTDLAIKNLYSHKLFTLFLGGDHSVSIKTQKEFINAYSGKKIGIIHCDAHADICDIYDDNKLSHACVNRRAVDSGISDNDIVYIGIRSWEMQEIEYFNKFSDIMVHPMISIHEKGLDCVIKEVVKKFKNYDAIYLSFDIDCVDPSSAPGTGTPEAGGMSSYNAMKMVKSFVEELNVVTLDMVEVSPPLDSNDITSWTALKIIYEAINQIALKKEKKC